jgi:hypothetical protein
MKQIIIVGILILTIYITGCSVELDTGMGDCRSGTSGIFGLLGGELADSDCQNYCRQKGYEYNRWKCSERDTLVCICNGYDSSETKKPEPKEKIIDSQPETVDNEEQDNIFHSKVESATEEEILKINYNWSNKNVDYMFERPLKGMSLEDILIIFGEPDRIDSIPNVVDWYYYDGNEDKTLALGIVNGEVKELMKNSPEESVTR